MSHFSHHRHDFTLVFHAGNLVEHRFHRFCPLLVQGYAVHSHVIQVTDFLCSRTSLIIFLCSQSFNQFAQLLLAVFKQFIKCAVTRIFGSQRMCIVPSSTCVTEKVRTGRHSSIHVCQINARSAFRFLLSSAACQHSKCQRSYGYIILLVHKCVILIKSLLFISFLPVPTAAVSIPLLPPQSVFSAAGAARTASYRKHLQE